MNPAMAPVSTGGCPSTPQKQPMQLAKVTDDTIPTEQNSRCSLQSFLGRAILEMFSLGVQEGCISTCSELSRASFTFPAAAK